MSKTFKCNGIEQNIPEGAKIFSDFLSELNQTISQGKMVIAQIRINGKEISEADEKAFQTMPISEVGDIEIDTANPMDLAYETLNTLEMYLDRLSQSIARAALHYREKNLVTGDMYFAKSIDGLDLFVQTIGGVKLALRVGLNTKLALTEATLVSIMNDLLEAKRQNNYVFLAELLDSDLIGNLKEWKDQIFPLLRNLRNS